MDEKMIWHILEMEPTKDEDALKAQYHKRLTTTNPEDDPEGFRCLREAYEAAVELARRPETEEEEEQDEYDLWLQGAEEIYTNYRRRNDIGAWMELFSDPLCVALDTADMARDRLLIYLMRHVYMSRTIWALIENTFRIKEDREVLLETFPPDYLDYLVYQAEHDQFLPYEFLQQRDPDSLEDLEGVNPDPYIMTLLRMKNAVDNKDAEAAAQFYEELVASPFYHPYEDAEYAYLLVMQGKKEEAVELATARLQDLPDQVYLRFCVAELCYMADHIEDGDRYVEEILAEEPNHYSARFLKARANVERAPLVTKEIVIDLLEEDARNDEALRLMTTVNVPLKAYYLEKAEKEPENYVDNMVEAAWCMFQNEEYEDAIKAVSDLHLTAEDSHYYDYTNIMGRSLLGLERYAEAIPYLQKWEESRHNLVDDGDPKFAKRKARKGYIYFAIGNCYLALNRFDEARKYLEDAVHFEKEQESVRSYQSRIVVLYYRRGDYRKCEDLCTEILRQDSNYYPAYVYRQMSRHEMHDAQGVVDDYYQAVRLFAGYYKPYYYAAEVFLHYHQFEDAKKALDAAEEAGAVNPILDYLRIRVTRALATKTSDLDAAEALIEQLKKENRKKKRAPKIRRREEDMTDAELLDEMFFKDHMDEGGVDPVDLLCEEALLQVDRRDYDKAILVLERGRRSVTDEDNLLRLNWIRADVLKKQGQYSKAAMAYKKLVAKMPDNLDVAYSLGICYIEMKKYVEALDVLMEIHKTAPDYQRVDHAIMRIYRRIYDTFELPSAYRNAVEFETRQIDISESAYDLIERGLLYMRRTECEKAMEDYRRAIELEPSNPYAHNNLGFAYFIEGDYSCAEDCYKQAIECLGDEETLLPYLNLAKLYEATGKLPEAVRVLLNARKRRDDIYAVHDRLSEIYCFMGKYGDSLREIADAYDKKMISFREYNRRKLNILSCDGQVKKVKKEYSVWLSKPAVRTDKAEYYTIMEYYGDFLFYLREHKTAFKVLSEVRKFKKSTKSSSVADVSMKLALICGFLAADATPRSRQQQKWQEECRNFAREAKADLIARGNVPKEWILEEDEKLSLEENFLNFPEFMPFRYKQMALIYACLGDFDRAVELLNRIPKMKKCRHCAFTSCYDASLAWGMLEELLGHKEKAAKHFQTAHRINPSDFECVLTKSVYEHLL